MISVFNFSMQKSSLGANSMNPVYKLKNLFYKFLPLPECSEDILLYLQETLQLISRQNVSRHAATQLMQ